MEGEQQVRCPLCDGTYEGGAAYAAHLRDVHDLVDDEVPEAHDGPGAESGALDLGVLAAAAASLAAADEESLPVPPAPAPETQPTQVAPRSPARRRGLAVVSAAVLLAVAVWRAGSSDDPPPVAGDRERGGLADGGIGPGNGLVEVGGTSAVPPTTATPGAMRAATVPVTTAPPSPTDPGAQPRTTQPGSTPSTGSRTSTTTSPSPPPPPPPPPPPTTTTTTRPTTVRATEASVVRCTKGADDRTLVYSFVLSGSTTDGRHELTVTFPVSSGPIIVSAVSATEPGGRTVVVPLEPGPVICD